MNLHRKLLRRRGTYRHNLQSPLPISRDPEVPHTVNVLKELTAAGTPAAQSSKHIEATSTPMQLKLAGFIESTTAVRENTFVKNFSPSYEGSICTNCQCQVLLRRRRRTEERSSFKRRPVGSTGGLLRRILFCLYASTHASLAAT